MQIDVGEENVVEAEIQQSTEVQTMAEVRWKAMEIERHELKVVMKRRHAILDRITLLQKGIKILDLDWFMWT